MSLQIFSARDWLTKVDFDQATDFKTYPESEYTCSCGQVIMFNMGHLEKHLSSEFSNLSLEDRLRVKVYANDLPKKPGSFLDFYCPGCKTPTSFFYFMYPGKGHGIYEFEIEYIIR